MYKSIEVSGKVIKIGLPDFEGIKNGLYKYVYSKNGGLNRLFFLHGRSVDRSSEGEVKRDLDGMIDYLDGLKNDKGFLESLINQMISGDVEVGSESEYVLKSMRYCVEKKVVNGETVWSVPELVLVYVTDSAFQIAVRNQMYRL
ncbi:hypothetical protein MOD96_01265 [Bacillus sp. S17B2]|uniref:hypothetical protein n=1 Tax=Bacillus sp. S17B2 TaxID=2918907 RepID=UPI00228062D0|nr:hypothetical protein [Bacillus sp. S17B2]